MASTIRAMRAALISLFLLLRSAACAQEPMKTSALVLAGLVAASCGSSSPTAPTIGPQTSVLPPYQGSWSGQTAQGQAITFTVSGSSIVALNFRYDYSPADPGCSGAGGEFHGAGALPGGTIAGDRFVIAISSQTSAFSLSGAFATPATVSGTLAVVITAPAPGATHDCRSPVDTTWTATKSS